jgi:hypothetical protein
MSESQTVEERRTTDKGLGGRVVSIEDRLDRGDKRMGSIEKDLADNTAATREVLEIVTMGRSFFKVAGQVGNFIKWSLSGVAALGAAYAAWKQGGGRP